MLFIKLGEPNPQGMRLANRLEGVYDGKGLSIYHHHFVWLALEYLDP